ncbi:MAG: PssD/Cps14F family polysaccharide biosynthesis glycosyltransferase [Cyanobacteria bacterium P01_A01_bin.17]
MMKLLLVCNPGGHFASMMKLERFWSSYSHEWVTYPHYDTRTLVQDGEIVHWVAMQEARMIGRACVNFFHALFVLYKRHPDLVISTGAGISVPFVLASKIFGIRTIFIENKTRFSNLSLSGKILYFFVDELYVQWPECIDRYPRAIFKGVL